MRPLRLTAAAALTLPIAACTMTPATTPTPVPTTYQCTPEAGGAPYTCTEAEHQEMVKKDALYAEAEQVYRQLVAEHTQLFEDGREAGDEVLGLATGEAVDTLREAHKGGVRFKGGKAQLISVKRFPGRVRNGSVVALESCIDTTQVDLYRGNVHLGRGGVALERAYFAPVEGALRMNYVESKSVESC